MNKNIKIIFVVVVLFILSFLFLRYKGYEKQQDIIFSLKTTSECVNICEEFYLKDKSFLEEYNAIIPKYFYNKKNNACYYSGGISYIDLGAENVNFDFRHIYNCQTREKVLCLELMGGKSYLDCSNKSYECAHSLDAYNEKERQIMKE